MQPVLDAELARHRDHGPALDGVDLTPVLAHARTFLAERPRTGTELRDEFAARFPDLDAPALAYACRNLLAFVQVPPRGVWGRTAQVTSTTAEAWLGRELVRRALDRRGGPPLPRRVRAGDGRRRVVVVAPDRDARGGRTAAAATPGVPSTSEAASCSICPTHRVPIPTRRHRRGFSPSTTTCCCRTPTVPASCATTGAGSRGPHRIIHGTVLHDGTVAGTWHIERDRASGAATLVVVHVRAQRTSAGLGHRRRTSLPPLPRGWRRVARHPPDICGDDDGDNVMTDVMPPDPLVAALDDYRAAHVVGGGRPPSCPRSDRGGRTVGSFDPIARHRVGDDRAPTVRAGALALARPPAGLAPGRRARRSRRGRSAR